MILFWDVLFATVIFYYYPQQANESEYLGEFNLYYIYLLIWFIYLFEFVLVQIGTNK